MVDFKKLRSSPKPKAIDPIEILRRLPKPDGFNDLYGSQTEVLTAWFGTRAQRDTVVKLHTGGGKTLVGLLMAQSTLNETGEPVLYVAPNNQLVSQTLDKARAHGIAAVPYEKGKPLSDDFVNGSALMVCNYKALFNGRSKFGLRGAGVPRRLGAVILDDAHVSFSVVRDSFTLSVCTGTDEGHNPYESLCGLFRKAFKDADRLGTFDDTVSGQDFAVLEVPHWAWHENLDAVREILKTDAATKHALVWPFLRDRLHLCHALISRKSFTITPVAPLVDAIPAFSEAPRRIYMSATIADDSEIVRTFDAELAGTKTTLRSRSLAGVSERMILVPDLMPFQFDAQDATRRLLEWVAEQKLGAVVLVPSEKATEAWTPICTVAKDSSAAEALIGQLQRKETFGPVVFANRYDGIDLPGDSCRLLVMDGLPRGTSDYEIFRASTLYGGATITQMLAQRIEQGIGRGARGAGDFCVVVICGSDLASWLAKDANFRFLTGATRAQIEMGANVSASVEDLKDLATTIRRSLQRDVDWTTYHAETLAELVDENGPEVNRTEHAVAERKAINLWRDGYHDKAITRLEKLVTSSTSTDDQTIGWLLQLASRIADHWGNATLAEDYQRQAFAKNRNLTRPKVLPPYRPLIASEPQERAIVAQLGYYRVRRGFLHEFELAVSHLDHNAPSNQFEESLCKLGSMVGLSATRHDVLGEGPDVLWLLPDGPGLVIEAKSRKMEKNALTKEQHGQLLVAAEWFKKHYPSRECVRVSVHPQNLATRAAIAGASHALTYAKLAALVADARALLTNLCESQLSEADLIVDCGRQLSTSSLRVDKLVKGYLLQFQEH